jgi:hypothetical protein
MTHQVKSADNTATSTTRSFAGNTNKMSQCEPK